MADRLWIKVEARRWPGSPHVGTEVTIQLKHHPYNASVVFIANDVDMALEPFAIQVFRNDGGRFSARDVQRLPLGRITATAKAFALSPGVKRAIATGRKGAQIDVSKLDAAAPRPKSSFDDPRDKYQLFADLYRHYQKYPKKRPAGAKSAAEATAIRLKMKRGTVDWMKHRARTRYGIEI